MNAIAKRLPFVDYCAIPEAHSTSLFNILTSPLQYKFRKENSRFDTDAFRLGRAGHTAILEPERFERDYAVWRGKTKRDARIEAYAQFLADNEGKTQLTVAQYDAAWRVAKAASLHPVAGPLLREAGESELVVRWTHPSTGIPCKARIDRLTTNLIDLKLSRDITPALFSGAAARYGYAFQLAFYRDGVISTMKRTPPTKIIAIQNSEPHDIAVFNLPTETLTLGNEQVERAMAKLAECTASGEWPGAFGEEVDLLLPSWVTAAADEEPITFGEEVL